LIIDQKLLDKLLDRWTERGGRKKGKRKDADVHLRPQEKGASLSGL